MISLVDVQQVAPRVLARLKKLAPLPQHGVVAGQSVASLVYEELGLPISGPLNDIDVFVSKNLPASERGVVYSNDGQKTKLRASSFTQWKSMTASKRKITVDTEEESDYKFLNIIGQRGTISVLRTYRRDLLNYTLVEGEGMGPGGFVNVQVGQGLVNGFDLNCVAVGIDLHTGRLVCTDDFVDFLNTYTLKPQSYHTPGYTLIRMAKKIFGDQMVGVVCDFEKEKEILLCGSELQQQRIWPYHRDGGHLYTFGPKYAEMLKPFAQHLPAMVESVHDGVQLWSFASEMEHPKFAQLSAGFKNVATNHVEFARGIIYTKHLSAVWNLEDTERTAFFAKLRDTDSDHFDVLRMVKPPTPITSKILHNGTTEEMQVCMPNSSLSVPEQDLVVDVYNSWNTETRNLFHHFRGELHEIPLYQDKPLEFYQRKFLELGLEFFQASNTAHAAVARSLYPQIMEFAATQGRETVRRAMEQRKFSISQYYQLPVSPHEFMTQLIHIALGEDLKVTQTDSTRMVSNIVSWLYDRKAPLPQALPSLHASRALRKISYTPQMKDPDYTQYTTDVLTQLLSAAEDKDLKIVYITDLISSGGRDILEHRLMQMDNDILDEFKTAHYKKINDYFSGNELNEKLQTTTVFFEKISLTKAVSDTLPPVKISRKM